MIRGKAFAEAGVDRLPACGSQFRIRDALVGEAPFALAADAGVRWHGLAEELAAPRVIIAVLDRRVIGRVVDFARFACVDQMDESGHEIALVNLVDPAQAIALDHGLAAAEFFEERAALRAVNSRRADDARTGVERHLLGPA